MKKTVKTEEKKNDNVINGIKVTVGFNDTTEYKIFTPMDDPLLLKFYLARVAAHTPNSPLTFGDELDLAIQALGVWRHEEQVRLGLIQE